MLKRLFITLLFASLALFAGAVMADWPPGEKIDKVLQAQEKPIGEGLATTAAGGVASIASPEAAASKPEDLIDTTQPSADDKGAMTPILGDVAFLACTKPDKGSSI